MRRIHNCPSAPDPIGPYNHSVWAGQTLYISGQISINPESGEFENGDMQAQTILALNNLSSILKSAGLDFSDLVKVTVFVRDMSKYALFNEEYGKFFDFDNAPARELVEVADLPKNAQVEISAIAYKA